uniref:OmpL47-type beta-barrel domain-containing protein n=1 Tax=Paenibacillus zanthoxyli TaxID=369399 RepID=UPI00055DB95E
MKKISIILLCLILQFSLFNFETFGQSIDTELQKTDIENELQINNPEDQQRGSIGILSTNVWAEDSEIEIGSRNMRIHYSFNDSPHQVEIKIYRNNELWTSFYRDNGLYSDTFEYTTEKDGVYRIVVRPTNAYSYGGECTVTVYRNVVVLIPGIMGSEMFEQANNNKVWKPGNLTFARDIPKLKMNADGTSIVNLKSGIPIKDFYEDMATYLFNNNFKVINFGYDWRLDIKDSARSLKTVIDNAKIDNPYSKIYIVAHSMGGLVATEYINQGNGNNINKLITIGTPYLGAPKAAYIFETGNGASTLQNLAINSLLKDVVPNIYSVYQLLPPSNYFDWNHKDSYITYVTYTGAGRQVKDKVKVTGYNATTTYFKERRPWSNDNYLDKANEFHNSLNIIRNLNSVDSYYIIGDKNSTVGEMAIKMGTQPSITNNDLKMIQGDGTVPVISANVAGRLPAEKTYYIQEEHGELFNNVKVQKQVVNILKGVPNEVVSGIRKTTEKQKSVGVIVEAPANLNVYDSLGNHVGPTASGEYEKNIPYSEYLYVEDEQAAFLNEGNYNVVVNGTSYGKMVYTLKWIDENDQEARIARFDDIDVTPTSVFTSATNRVGQIFLNIDYNGDGTIDSTIEPSVDLGPGGSQDEILPTISSHVEGVKGINEWYGKNVYYNLTGEDDASGVYKTFYDLNESEYKEYTEPVALPETGIYNFKSYVRDRNRNDSEVLTETVKVDTTNPTVPVMTVEPTKWTNQFVTVSLSGGTDVDSGFQKYQYKINEDGEWKDYTSPFIIDTEGLYNVFARSVDNVFNLSEEVTGVAKVDKTNPPQPIMTVEPMKWTNLFVTVTLSGGTDTDKGFPNSGFQKYQYKIGQNGEWKDYTSPIIIDTEGLYNVFARSVDNASNFSEEVVGDAKVDKTKPSVPTGFDIVSFNYNKVKISWLSSTDNVGVIGYDVYQYSELLGRTTDTEFTFNNLDSNKTYTFKVVARDEAENSSLDGVYVVRTPISLVSAGTFHTLQIKEDGTVRSWGNNSSGQLGDGTTTSKTTAVQIPGLTHVLSVAAGSGHSVAL